MVNGGEIAKIRHVETEVAMCILKVQVIFLKVHIKESEDIQDPTTMESYMHRQILQP